MYEQTRERILRQVHYEQQGMFVSRLSLSESLYQQGKSSYTLNKRKEKKSVSLSFNLLLGCENAELCKQSSVDYRCSILHRKLPKKK